MYNRENINRRFIGLHVHHRSVRMLKAQKDQEIDRMFYIRGLPFNLAKNPYYVRAFQFAANNKIHGYVPPDNVHKLLEPLRSTWKEKGVTIMSDGWSDPTGKPLINLMPTSGNGPLFLKVVNCLGKKIFLAPFSVYLRICHQIKNPIIANKANVSSASTSVSSSLILLIERE
uniref:DUF659 domain-containing protein n=1 Tax=Lactuca sativa TaxID=4236 RepID=A0A9R1UXV8_LACSA|nr:hypothetical protein LSAT_V11C700348470 [Lactuca sativa]